MTRPTRGELIKINRELALVGERICSGCWRRLPLAAFAVSHGRPFRCKDCHRTAVREAMRRRYRNDRDYRAACIVKSRTRYLEDPARHRAANRASYHRKKVRRLARLLQTT